MTASLTLTFTTDGIAGQFERLTQALVGFADGLGERRALFLDDFVGLVEAGTAFNLDAAPATRAGELRIGLKASDALVKLMRTSGAGDREIGLIEEALRHGDAPSSLDLDNPTIDRVGAGGPVAARPGEAYDLREVEPETEDSHGGAP